MRIVAGPAAHQSSRAWIVTELLEEVTSAEYYAPDYDIILAQTVEGTDA